MKHDQNDPNPLVRGGQGRSDEELRRTAVLVTISLLAVIAGGMLIAIGVAALVLVSAI